MKIQIISTESPDATLKALGATIEGDRLHAADGITRHVAIVQRRAGIDCIETLLIIAREPIPARAVSAAIYAVDNGPLPTDGIITL